MQTLIFFIIYWLFSKQKIELFFSIHFFNMNQEELEFFQQQGIQCINTIAQGGFGVVFYVYSVHYKANYALKKIPLENFNESEIECVKQIDVPDIVNLYQYYKFGNSVYMLMEYCPSDLYKYLKSKGELSWEQLRNLTYDMINAIKQCHSRGIAHCDIKPSNFMLDKYERLKIGDFGLATFTHLIKNSNRGTALFMAPECFLKDSYDPFKADIWALGVTVFYLATNHYPFNGETKSILVQKIISICYSDDSIEDFNVRYLISRCFEKNPLNRPTCEDLLRMPYFGNMNANQGSCLPLLRKDRVSKSCEKLVNTIGSYNRCLKLQHFRHNSRLSLLTIDE